MVGHQAKPETRRRRSERTIELGEGASSTCQDQSGSRVFSHASVVDTDSGHIRPFAWNVQTAGLARESVIGRSKISLLKLAPLPS